MSSLSNRSDISGYKSQLDEFLSRKYVDQSLLLGFTAVVQSKFSNWIDKDIDSYYEELQLTQNGQPNPANFALIQLFETLWGLFHHPIIKFYQLQHAELYNALIGTLKSAKPAFKSVEMRKLNETFSKFIKSARDFYFNLLKKIMRKYTVLLIPEKWLEDINIHMTQDGLKAASADFDANLTYIVYHCLLGLGNLARHSTQINLTYAQPCKSVAEYYRCMKQQKATDEEAKLKYSTAMHYYSLCLGLLPTLNEPYNNQGVVYNNLKLKFNATVLFLRSQFTRIPNYPIGRHNLDTIFTKPWLEAAFHAMAQKKPTSLGKEDYEIMMLKIIKFYAYRDSRLGSFNVEKAQNDLLNYLFPPGQSGFAQHAKQVENQLTVMICFYMIVEAESRPAQRKQFRLFVTSYISRYLRSVEHLTETGVSGALKNIRLILAFVRKNQNMGSIAESLVDVLNSLIVRFDDSIKTKLFEADDETPTRSYYFEEDVEFKDFLPIGYQFKDFNDNFLFSSGNVNVLFGSDCYTRTKDIPEFLDNEAAQRIIKETELGGGDESGQLNAVEMECDRYENELRLHAITVTTFKVFGSRILADREKQQFVLAKVDVPETQPEKKPVKAKNTQKSNQQIKKATKQRVEAKLSGSAESKRPAPEITQTANNEVPVASQVMPTQAVRKGIPSSLDEIELIILGHASGLDKQESTVVSEDNLSGNVSSIVDGSQARENPQHPMLLQNVKIAKRKPAEQAVEPQVIATQLSDRSDLQNVHSGQNIGSSQSIHSSQNINTSPNIDSSGNIQSSQKIQIFQTVRSSQGVQSTQRDESSSTQSSEVLSNLQVQEPLHPSAATQPNGVQPINHMGTLHPQFPSHMPMFPQQNFGFWGQIPQMGQMGQPQMPQIGPGPGGQMLSYGLMALPQIPNNNLPYDVYAPLQPIPGQNFQNQMFGIWNGNSGGFSGSYNGQNGPTDYSQPPGASSSLAETAANSQSSQVQVHSQSQPNALQSYFASQYPY